MRAYSTDLRERIVRAVASGQPQREAARRFGVASSTVKRYLQRQAQTGSVARRPIPGGPRKIGGEQEAALRAQLVAQPSATLAEHCVTWEQTHRVHVSPATLSRAIRRLGFTRKKGRWWPASATRPRARPGG
jgi:transposase